MERRASSTRGPTVKDLGLMSEPQHNDTYPIPLSWEEFIGPNSAVDRDGVLEIANIAQARHMHRIPEKPLLRVEEDYVIYASRYTSSPRKHALLEEKYGPGVVAHYGDIRVGVARKHLIWVHREHKGKRLAVEMAIAWLLYYGYDAWTFKQSQTYNYTPAGYLFRERQYQTMLARGIVCTPDQ